MNLRVFMILVFTCFVTLLFALEISPNLIYQIESAKYQFSYELYVKNDIPYESKVTVEVIDFITDGRSYSFDEPDYKYSLRNHVSVNEKEIILAVNEQKPVKLEFNVPQNFPGATGVFALRISQESTTGGKVQIRLNYIVPFFIRFTVVPIFQSVKIKDISVRDLSLEPDDEYGNYGSLITLEIENNGNIGLIPKGSILVSARELKTTIAEVPIDSFDLVVFPEKRTYYTFYIPCTLPSGTLDINLSGKSYGLDFSTNASKKIENKNNLMIVKTEPQLVIFNDKNKNTVYSLTISNLSFIKDSIIPIVNSDELSFIPKKSIIYPYRTTSFNVRTSTKDFGFSGDRIYEIKFQAESSTTLRNVQPAYVVLRGKTINALLEGHLESSQFGSSLVVSNEGNCVVQFDVMYGNQKLNSESLVIFPGQTLTIDFGTVINKNQLQVKYGPYGENTTNSLEDF